MNPGLIVKLRPTGPWRIGPDSGARNRVDAIYHSDSLYSAVAQAMSRLGALDEWLDATARSAAPAVCFGSCFPLVNETMFVTPPRTVWPPSATSLTSGRVRWKSARFVPLNIVHDILVGKKLDENRWMLDGPSGCLMPAGKPGPFRSSLRWSAAIDRLSGAAERHASACLEFRPGAGFWTVVSFIDAPTRDRWQDRVKAAFRWLADSGFGGERSRGWGRAEAPGFVEGMLPEMILGKRAASAARQEAQGPDVFPPIEEPPPEEPPVIEPPAENPDVNPPEPPPEPELPPPDPDPVPATGQLETEAESEADASQLAGSSIAPLANMEPEPATGQSEAESQGESSQLASSSIAPLTNMEPEPATGQSEAESQGEASQLAGSSIAPLTDMEPEPATGQSEAESQGEASQLASPSEAESQGEASQLASPSIASFANPEPEPAAGQLEAASETEASHLAVSSIAPVTDAEPDLSPPAVAASPEPIALSAGPQASAAQSGPRAQWLLSLFSPAAADAVEWARGSYSLIERGGRVESSAGSGALKKQVQMVCEGSVLYAGGTLCGAAPDVAPEGFAHPVFRAGFALAIPLPEVG